jgi:hypothetical protein
VADASGNVALNVPAGTYDIYISGIGINTFKFTQTISADGEGIVYASDFIGSDMGAQINAAYAALTANGGKIIVPTGTFTFSTPIVFGTANKPAILEGAGYGTQLTFTPTSGTCITMNYGPGVVTNHPRGAGLRDLVIIGPGATSTGIGLLLGGTNGAEGFKADGINIGGFNQVIVYGNNAWATEFHNSIIRDGVTNLLSIPGGLTNSGEQLSFSACTFIQDGASFACASAIVNAFSGAYLTMVDCSVDNAQIVVSGGGHVGVSNLHMEYLSPQTVPFISITSGILYGSDFDFANDVAGTTAASVVAVFGPSGQFSASSIKVTSGLYTFPAFAALTNGAELDVWGNSNAAGNGWTNFLSLTTFSGTYVYDQMGSSIRVCIGTGFSDTALQLKNETSPNGQGWLIDSLSSGHLSIFPQTNVTRHVQIGAAALDMQSNAIINSLLTAPIVNGAAPTVAAAQIGLGSTTATSATAGANGAVPAQVAGYIVINVAGTAMKIPYFNT